MNARLIVPTEGVLTVFVDGSSLSSPRRGGTGVVFVFVDAQRENRWTINQPGYRDTTNNQMELLAVSQAIDAIQDRGFDRDILTIATKIEIYTDSSYVVDNLINAIYVWPKNKWMTSAGPPVENAKLWIALVKSLVKLRAIKRVEIRWGKGHSHQNPNNHIADGLAKQSARLAPKRTLGTIDVRRKHSPHIVTPGSVRVRGQLTTIRIISSKLMLPQSVYKYKYEVMSERSPDYQKVDWIYAGAISLRAGHTYRVRMNKNPSYPQIQTILNEVGPLSGQPSVDTSHNPL